MSMRRKLPVSIALALVLTMLMTLTASAQEAALEGSANFRDAEASSDSLEVNLDRAAVLSSGSQYEGWLVDISGNKMSVGTFGRRPELIGTYVDPDGRDLLAKYTTFIVTIEPNPDSDPEPSDEIAYGDSTPLVISNVISQLVGPGGPARAINAQAQLAVTHANLAAEADSLDVQKAHAQHVINIIQGSSGANYNAEAGDPGDGVGLLGHAQAVGPLAAAAEEAAGDDEELEDTAGEIATAVAVTVAKANNTVRVAQRIVDATTGGLVVDKEVENLVSNTARLLNGTDEDGENGPGSTGLEAGARTVYEMSQDLGEFRPGLGAPPPTGDSTLPLLAIIVLGAGVALVSTGGFLVFRGRRVTA